ncbi:MAG: FMN reductase [Acidobacteria bacterium]|nr:FMN reductase [Acidobacteriota bacterium]NIM60668.1 FMN reductase [Acidobacteriota bacterium]NIO58628.1 FMN reductase [Acidobacteriota bacterium]NIQ29684.1 FMN reductase [Acidobacteriota bacterium]NIQ84401.1 FMN reductase [Acidobacteriota bacterium]
MLSVVAFSGSSRSGSLNKKLVHAAVLAVRDAGAEVEEIDLRDYPMPLYDGDDEEANGPPENAARLRELFASKDAFLIGCPEYNGLITPLLKNTIDWVSRPDADGKPGTLSVKGKLAALTAASPGGLGGLRGLVHVRMLLSNIGMFVLPDQLALPGAKKAFDENGALKDDSGAKRLTALAESFVRAGERLKR